MSNRKRIKNRPPFRQVGPKNPSVEELVPTLTSSVRLFMIQIEHEDWCSAADSQNFDNCTCEPNHRLMRYAPEHEGAQR